MGVQRKSRSLAVCLLREAHQLSQTLIVRRETPSLVPGTTKWLPTHADKSARARLTP